ncbi:MAG: Mur ligase family protein, partial [Planctomycetota bacterium]
MLDLDGKRVVIMGLGRFGGGVGAARFCCQQGADTLVTDLLDEHALAESLEKLDGLDLQFRLGEHAVSDFIAADVVLVNPAVDPRRNRYIHAAREASVTLTTEIQLLIERLDRQRVIAVTGTTGKSTTTAMIGHILQKTYTEGATHVGGNIGHSLLPHLHQIAPEDWVVLELSSFMLESITDWSPHIAVVTNLTDNHLDRHETMEAYAAAKQNILRSQTPDDFAILGEPVANWSVYTLGRSRVVTEPFDAALADFSGLEHRLQFVGEHNGVKYYNDSKCTTPDAAVLALDAFETGTAHIILGGYDKNADLTPIAFF